MTPSRGLRPLLLLTLALGLTPALSQAQLSPSPTPNAPTQVALADVVQQHTHSIAISDDELGALISQASNGTPVSLQSSEGYAGGISSGTAHTHRVPLSLRDLRVLQQIGTVSIQSDTALGHSHLFTFVSQKRCQALAGGASSPSPVPSSLPIPSITAIPP